jgi:hypothetical protein
MQVEGLRHFDEILREAQHPWVPLVFGQVEQLQQCLGSQVKFMLLCFLSWLWTKFDGPKRHHGNMWRRANKSNNQADGIMVARGSHNGEPNCVLGGCINSSLEGKQ